MQLLKAQYFGLRNCKYVCTSRILTWERCFCKDNSKSPDHYETLGLEKSASHSEIKKAYYDLSKMYHPDRNESNVKAATKFREVTEAYEVLGNFGMRKRYDKGLPLPLAQRETRTGKPIVEPKVQYQSFFDGRTKMGKTHPKYKPIGEPEQEAEKRDPYAERLEKEFNESKRVQNIVLVTFLGIFLYMATRTKG